MQSTHSTEAKTVFFIAFLLSGTNDQPILPNLPGQTVGCDSIIIRLSDKRDQAEDANSSGSRGLGWWEGRLGEVGRSPRGAKKKKPREVTHPRGALSVKRYGSVAARYKVPTSPDCRSNRLIRNKTSDSGFNFDTISRSSSALRTGILLICRMTSRARRPASSATPPT